MLDSGSPISIIKNKFVNPEVILPINDSTIAYHGVNNSQLRFLGKTKAKCQLNGCVKDIELLIVDVKTMNPSVILGRDALRSFGLGFSQKEEHDKNEDNDFQEILNIEMEEVTLLDQLDINDNIPFRYIQELKNAFESLYIQPERPEVPKIKTTLNLRMKDHKPFNCAPRRLAFAEKCQLKNLLDDLLKRRVIRLSNAVYASPVVLIRKKNGKIRMCIDYRVLNKYLESDNYPFPLIEDIIALLQGKNILVPLI